jgi:hypothetical protein
MNRSSNLYIEAYTEARDARIRQAMWLLSGKPEEERGEGKMGRMCLGGGLWSYQVAALAMFLGGSSFLGGLIVLFGSLCFIVGFVMLVEAGSIFDETFSRCMREVDEVSPEFRRTMMQHKNAAVLEEWSTD